MELTSVTEQESLRISSIEGMLPDGITTLLEVGSRDGRVTQMLVRHSDAVTALDLEMPAISLPHVTCVKGDVTKLQFAEEIFDCVVCTEVLEHVVDLGRACEELSRVTRKWLLVGVPFDQDLRVGRLTCSHCGRINPPYGHVNRFTEERLRALFPSLSLLRVERLGTTKEATNAFSTWLLDRSRNPWGTYEQTEPCMFCGVKLTPPESRTLSERVMAAAALRVSRLQEQFVPHKAIWIHCLFAKQ